MWEALARALPWLDNFVSSLFLLVWNLMASLILFFSSHGYHIMRSWCLVTEHATCLVCEFLCHWEHQRNKAINSIEMEGFKWVHVKPKTGFILWQTTDDMMMWFAEQQACKSSSETFYKKRATMNWCNPTFAEIVWENPGKYVPCISPLIKPIFCNTASFLNWISALDLYENNLQLLW